MLDQLGLGVLDRRICLQRRGEIDRILAWTHFHLIEIFREAERTQDRNAGAGELAGCLLIGDVVAELHR
jgi:hypothetical protein